jgi:hypothetical protein
MHLHASVAAIRGDYDYTKSNNWEGIKSEIEKERHQNIIIIRVYPKNYYKFKDKNKDYILQRKSESLFLIEITLDELIGYLIFDKTSPDSTQKLMSQIFGDFKAKLKDAESISSNCLFEFRNGLNMSNIATIFKLSNIAIGGGNI